MDLANSDACDGRAQQPTSMMIILLLLVTTFFVIKELSLIFIWVTWGEELASTVSLWIDPVIIMVIGLALAAFHQSFWVNVKGNRIQPAVNILFPKKLRDGTTRFIVFTTGASIKLPWVFLQGGPLEVEKNRTEIPGVFTVTVEGTSLEIILEVAWKPHMHFLSTYLQNVTAVSSENQILGQLIAKTKQLVEEECARMGDPEDVRKHQSVIIRSVLPHVEIFGEYFGIDVVDISFSRCDYSTEVQTQMNRVKEAQSIALIRQELIASGMDPGEAARLAAVQSNVKGINITEQNIKGLDNVAKIVAQILGKGGTP